MSYRVDFTQAETDAIDLAKKQVAEMFTVSCAKLVLGEVSNDGWGLNGNKLTCFISLRDRNNWTDWTSSEEK